MIEKPEADHDAENGKSGDDGRSPLGYLQGVAIAAIWVFLVLLAAALFWPNLTERTKFFTGNFFNVLVAFAVIAQVLIYRKQWQVMERQSQTMDRSLIVSSRAYVGIHSIGIDFLTNRLHIQIENIGRVPAKYVKVGVQMEVAIPPGCMPEGYDLSRGAYVFTTKVIPFHYGEAKLFPGNLNIRIIIPIKRWLLEGLSDEQIHLITQAHARLIVRGNINFCDGFDGDKNTVFALRYSPRADCWLPHPILSPEEAEKVAKEQPYYED